MVYEHYVEWDYGRDADLILDLALECACRDISAKQNFQRPCVSY